VKIFNAIPKYLIVAASSWISRGISAFVQILSVRYLIEILGQDKYAAFILLSGLIAWSNLSDFGLGNAVLASISEKKAKNKKYSHLVFSCFIILLAFFILITFFLYFASDILSDIYLQAFDSSIVSNKEKTFFVATIIFCLTTFGGVVYKIWYAEQSGWLSNIYPAIASVIGLLGVYYISKNEIYNIHSVLEVFVVFFAPAAIVSLCLLIWKMYTFGSINLSISKNLKIIKILLYKAKAFFLFSIMGVIVLQTDYIVLSQKINANDIILYAVLMKIFSVIYFVYSSVLQAWWPVCTELRIKKKWKRLKANILFIVMLGGFSIAVLGFFVYLFQKNIFEMLNLKSINHVDFDLFLLLILYFIVRVWCDIYALLLQTMSYMKPLFVIVPVQVFVNLTLQWYLADFWGIYGILIGLIMSFLLTVVVFLPWQFNKQIRKEGVS